MLVKPATTSTVVEPDRTIDDTLKSNMPLSLCTFAVDAFPTSKKLKDPVTPEIPVSYTHLTLPTTPYV